MDQEADDLPGPVETVFDSSPLLINSVHRFQVDVKGQEEDEVHDQLYLEEVPCVGVPFVIYDDLDRLLLKEREIGRFLERFRKLDLLVTLDFVEVNVVEHHLVLFAFGNLLLATFQFLLFLLLLDLLHFAHREESLSGSSPLTCFFLALLKVLVKRFEVSISAVVFEELARILILHVFEIVEVRHSQSLLNFREDGLLSPSWRKE